MSSTGEHCPTCNLEFPEEELQAHVRLCADGTVSTHLVLSRSGVLQFPALSVVRAITNLDLSHNEIASLPVEIGQLIQLKQLNLRHNHLTTLPDSFSQLTQLESLDVSLNPFPAVPSQLQPLIGSLKQLRIFFPGLKEFVLPAGLQSHIYELQLVERAFRNHTCLLQVKPSLTDPAIDDPNFDFPHHCYHNPSLLEDPASRERGLLVFFPGTHGTAKNAMLFSTFATNLGYHVIVLQYPNSLAATAANRSADPHDIDLFRQEIIEGGKGSPQISVSAANGIRNRLRKLLIYLKRQQLPGAWASFLTEGNVIEWSKLTLAGHSQGAGHAALLGIKHKVNRVICTGGVKDYYRVPGPDHGPASWTRAPGHTDKGRFFCFNHVDDDMGCDWQEQLEICEAMGMHGPPTNVDETGPPYNHSRILFTKHHYQVPCQCEPQEHNCQKCHVAGKGKAAHGTLLSDQGTPTADGLPVFRPVWSYMLTTPLAKQKKKEVLLPSEHRKGKTNRWIDVPSPDDD